MKLPKAYEPAAYEPNVYAMWEASGAFSPSGQGKPFSIVMPPPNANGNLHLGHALTIGIQDILIRYHRMLGDDTIYIPGADHAGFETWVVYEKQLAKEGKSRFDFSREQLYQQVWDFVEKNRGGMELQSRALGASASWDDMVFTLDEKVVKTVYATFKRLWDDKLIYRGKRIVNFCTFHQTSFADIEVVHRDEKSSLWEVAYPMTDKVGEIVVVTTRPETLLGDTAIAVNPKDERYKDLVGTHVKVPIVNREIPIVADDLVDMQFGTGAVKVTPAHDLTDYEIGQHHDLPAIEVINSSGKLVDSMPAELVGLDVVAARKQVVDMLRAEELLRNEKETVHSVGHCYKCDTIIEPLLMDQWFLKVESLAKRAIDVIEAGEIKFYPKSKGKLTAQYLKNLRDWNLSRQIAWGIPIPAFQNVDDEDDWIFDTRIDQPTITVDGKTYKREEDTFDTWFSSGQLPYVDTDYITEGELKRFYPTQMMETGHDILFAWVSRMIMLGLYATDKVPFRDVYLHGLVLDEKGQKMSKSKGNVINPMDLVDQYGSDALRLGIITSRSAGMNQAFATDKVIAARNFCNKLWNIARYFESQITDSTSRTPEAASIADHWVLSRLEAARVRLTSDLEKYQFADAADTIYHTIWDDVADWYVESSKVAPNPSMMAYVLETILKLAHPFTPFVTEAIWSTLEWEQTPLVQSAWPGKIEYDAIAAAEFEQLQNLVVETRFVASELPGGKQTMLYEHDNLIADNHELVRRLAGLETVIHVTQPKGLRLAVPNREAWIKVSEEMLYEHQNKLETRLGECREQIHRLQGRLNSDSYVKNAPEQVVNQTRDQLAEQLELEKRLQRELQVLDSSQPDLL
jgi:valyl-tRNA synthetase